MKATSLRRNRQDEIGLSEKASTETGIIIWNDALHHNTVAEVGRFSLAPGPQLIWYSGRVVRSSDQQGSAKQKATSVFLNGIRE